MIPSEPGRERRRCRRPSAALDDVQTAYHDRQAQHLVRHPAASTVVRAAIPLALQPERRRRARGAQVDRRDPRARLQAVRRAFEIARAGRDPAHDADRDPAGGHARQPPAAVAAGGAAARDRRQRRRLPGRPRARRGRRPGALVLDHAAAAAPAGGGAPRVRGDRVARAAHAARLARGHARAAGRRPPGRAAGSGGRGGAARPRARAVAAARHGWPPTCSISAASTPRSACAPSRSSSASSAVPCWPSSSFPSASRGVNASARRRRQPDLGARGPGQRRPHPAHPARQRAARGAARQRDQGDRALPARSRC